MTDPNEVESDLSEVCWNCGMPMAYEHAHMKCRFCGWRDSCCDGGRCE